MSKRWIPRKGEQVRLAMPAENGAIWQGVVIKVSKALCAPGEVYLTFAAWGPTFAKKDEITILNA